MGLGFLLPAFKLSALAGWLADWSAVADIILKLRTFSSKARTWLALFVLIIWRCSFARLLVKRQQRVLLADWRYMMFFLLNFFLHDCFMAFHYSSSSPSPPHPPAAAACLRGSISLWVRVSVIKMRNALAFRSFHMYIYPLISWRRRRCELSMFL